MQLESRRLRARGFALATVLVLFHASGCSTSKPVETVDDSRRAAQHAAEADVAAQAAAGGPVVQGTASSIPSLDPDDSHVQRPLVAPPATAPPADKFDDKNFGHLLARCRDRGARHEWFDAVGDCRRAAEIEPDSIEPHAELMKLLVSLQSYRDAEISADRVLAARPNDPIALYYLAWSHRGRDEYPQAISALERAIAIEPKRVEFVQALAVTYRLAGNYGRSLETLEHAATLAPNDPKIQSMLKQTRAELAERLAPYQKLVKEKPDSFDNQAALAFMYQKYGLPQKALTTYDTSLQMMPAPLDSQPGETKKLAAQIHYNRGVVYRDTKRPELAEQALVQAMQLDPSLASFAWYYIGLSRYDAGKYDASIEALQKSIELAPDVADNRSALADAYAKAGKAGAAAEQRNAVAAIRAREAEQKAAVRKEEQEETARAAASAASAAAPAANAPSAVPATAIAAPAPATAPVEVDPDDASLAN